MYIILKAHSTYTFTNNKSYQTRLIAIGLTRRNWRVDMGRFFQTLLEKPPPKSHHRRYISALS